MGGVGRGSGRWGRIRVSGDANSSHTGPTNSQSRSLFKELPARFVRERAGRLVAGSSLKQPLGGWGGSGRWGRIRGQRRRCCSGASSRSTSGGTRPAPRAFTGGCPRRAAVLDSKICCACAARGYTLRARHNLCLIVSVLCKCFYPPLLSPSLHVVTDDEGLAAGGPSPRLRITRTLRARWQPCSPAPSTPPSLPPTQSATLPWPPSLPLTCRCQHLQRRWRPKSSVLTSPSRRLRLRRPWVPTPPPQYCRRQRRFPSRRRRRLCHRKEIPTVRLKAGRRLGPTQLLRPC